MPVYKHENRSGASRWGYQFSLPGASRKDRRRITESGFATKREAADAEATRRIDEMQKLELKKAGVGVSALPPRTLSGLLQEFFAQHVDRKLEPKTIERYHEQAAYLDPDLLAMPIIEITPLHLTREWNRLVERGRHHRRTQESRPLAAKTVRNIAGVISSAFARAIRWGLISTNPVTNSEPPRVKKHHGVALTTGQQTMVFEAASGPWFLAAFLEVAGALGARRGEVLALRWSDIQDSRATIGRSLTQTKQVLDFKGTKTDRPRVVKIPKSALATLESHRQRQNEFRRQFGPAYKTDMDLIFANGEGSPLKPDSVSASVSLLFRRLKLPKGASLHSLRHTHTSHLLAKGVPLPVVSARLGHSSTRVTAEIYSHMINGQDDEAAQLWDDFQQKDQAEKRAGDVQ
jgi:integrase